MIAIRTILRMLRADQRGATAIEYGLIAALIVIAMMGGSVVMGGGVGGMWGRIGSSANNYMQLSQSAVVVRRVAFRRLPASLSGPLEARCLRQVR